MGVKNEWNTLCKVQFDCQTYPSGGLSLWILTLHDLQDHARRDC